MIIKHLQLDYSRKQKIKQHQYTAFSFSYQFSCVQYLYNVYFVLLLLVVVASFCCIYLKCCICTILLKVAYCSCPTNAGESIKLFVSPNIEKHAMSLWSISLYGIFGYVIKLLQNLRFMIHIFVEYPMFLVKFMTVLNHGLKCTICFGVEIWGTEVFSYTFNDTKMA